MSILAYYIPSFKIYFVDFLSSHRNLQWVRYCPSLKYIFYISYLRILALQFVAIAPQFSSPGIAEIGKGSTQGNHFICSSHLIIYI